MALSPGPLKLIIALPFVLIFFSPITEIYGQNFKEPSRQRIDQYDACISNNIADLDDNVSEARTIADAINTICREKLKAMIASSLPKTDAELVAFRKMEILIPHYEEQVLPMVLQRRSSAKKKLP